METLWSESLVDFHHKLFDLLEYRKDTFEFYDASEWFKVNGPKAVDYYTSFMLLFISFSQNLSSLYPFD